jgi:hypothetical protein
MKSGGNASWPGAMKLDPAELCQTRVKTTPLQPNSSLDERSHVFMFAKSNEKIGGVNC